MSLYHAGGPEALTDRHPKPDRIWNRFQTMFASVGKHGRHRRAGNGQDHIRPEGNKFSCVSAKEIDIASTAANIPIGARRPC